MLLTARQKKILQWIVEEYVRTAEPVGSKALASLDDFTYSSATIRNEMAALEEMGLLQKTHTSSGRVPSEAGYKVYVEYILEQNKEKEYDDFPMIDSIFERNIMSREQAIKESMALVADLTNYASVALGDTAHTSKIKKLQIVSLGNNLAVLLMVTDKGYVETKKILIPEDINTKDIEKVINLLSDLLYDCPISDIDRTLRSRFAEEGIRKQIEYNEELVGVLVQAFASMAKDQYYMRGQENFLDQPEFQDIDKVKSLFEAMDDENIMQVVDVNNRSITVKIGKDNEVKAMEDCTVISVPYESVTGDRGAIAVIGPKRMDYRRVIPLLDYIATYIGKMK